MSFRRFLSVISALALSAAMLAFAVQPSAAQAAAPEEESDQPNFMSRLLGSVGLLQLPGPSIDTSERPPLVVPPMTNYVQPNLAPNADLMPRAQSQQNPWDFTAQRPEHLPPPQGADNRPPQQTVALPLPQEQNTARQRNPDFPVDPEVRAQKKKKKQGSNVAKNYDEQWDRLRPDQLQTSTGPKSRPDRPGTDTLGERNLDRAGPEQLNAPKSLRSLFGAQKEQPVVFQGEPERQTLTQPPAGYLTPSANAPYGVVTPDPKEKPVAGGHMNSPNNPDGAVAR